MLRVVPVLVLVAALAAGCGVRTSKPYTATGTAPCLKSKGFTGVTTAPKSFIAATAQNGGLQARAPDGNVVTIAFAADEGSVPQTEAAFRRFATGIYKKRLDTVMSADRNAVLVWGVTPDGDVADTARRCLKP